MVDHITPLPRRSHCAQKVKYSSYVRSVVLYNGSDTWPVKEEGKAER